VSANIADLVMVVCAVRAFDVRAYKAGDRQVKHFVGAQHNFEKNLLRCNWSPDGKMVCAVQATCVHSTL
jgi:Prp8 binding protein